MKILMLSIQRDVRRTIQIRQGIYILSKFNEVVIKALIQLTQRLFTKTYTPFLYHSMLGGGGWESADNRMTLAHFSQQIGFDISCKLSPIF